MLKMRKKSKKASLKRITSQNQFLNNVLESLTYPFYVLDGDDGIA